MTTVHTFEMNNPRDEFEVREKAFGPNIVTTFMLTHARVYPIGPKTFAGPHAEPKQCFSNALTLAHDNPALTYVEGRCMGIIPFDHAWCVDRDGFVVDPTLTNHDGRIKAYWGVPFITLYALHAALLNDACGVLDYFYAGKTAPKLYELGLEAGQQWLLDQLPQKLRKRARR